MPEIGFGAGEEELRARGERRRELEESQTETVVEEVHEQVVVRRSNGLTTASG